MKKKQLMPWAGRFNKPLSAKAFQFSKSLQIDKRLALEDIRGSLAHTEMLAREKIIEKKDVAFLNKELKRIMKEVKDGSYSFDETQEDIHMAIESELREQGEAGGKVHTARSRNDQVSLAERLFLKTSIGKISDVIQKFQHVLLNRAEDSIDILMPGYTHLQRAQPILLSHHFLAYIEMFERDRSRLSDCKARLNVSPLGSVALAGTYLPIDRSYVAKKLGFATVSANSIDSVSDRDYVIEFVSCCSITMMHLSRMAEELVLWSTQEFGFIEISDDYATGSSIMPQKKNPDIPELVRAKTGRVYGDLINILTVMKALPLSYNRDMQEDKLPMLDAFDTVMSCFDIFSSMLEKVQFRGDVMHQATYKGYCTATEITDYLVKKSMPFRVAHEITGKIVNYAIVKKKTLEELSLEEYVQFSKEFSDDIFSILSPLSSVQRKKSLGGTAPKEVKKQIARWKRKITKNEKV